MAARKNGKGAVDMTPNGEESDSGSDLEPYSRQYLDGLLEKATLAFENAQARTAEEDVILLHLEDDESYVPSSQRTA
jgi:hypothetical protein